MEYTKISQFTKFSVPIKWSGEFDGQKIQEKITYKDGTELEMFLELGDKNQIQNNLERLYSEHIQIEDVSEYEEDDEDDDCYVMVEENNKSFLVHKDILDVYLELIEKE